MVVYGERFCKAFNYMLLNEGGYVFDKSDPGGETKFGICRRSYPSLDIKKLTQEQAQKIYYCDFWLKGKFEKIRDDRVAIKLFDLAVNVGMFQANKLIQRALWSAGEWVLDDGIIGEKTLSAINSCNANLLVCVLKSEAAGFYRLLAETKNMGRFLQGWLNRAYKSV